MLSLIYLSNIALRYKLQSIFAMQIVKTTRHLQQHILKAIFNHFCVLGLRVGIILCNFVNWLQMLFVAMFLLVVAADDRETIIL